MCPFFMPILQPYKCIVMTAIEAQINAQIRAKMNKVAAMLSGPRYNSKEVEKLLNQVRKLQKKIQPVY